MLGKIKKKETNGSKPAGRQLAFVYGATLVVAFSLISVYVHGSIS